MNEETARERSITANISCDTQSLTQIWYENPEIIKEYFDKHSKYHHLCTEVTYILERGFKKMNIEFSSISHRVKSLDSFVEKIDRKKYGNPLKDITDFAGVRVVYLYCSDFEKIEKILNTEFIILEKVDKIEENGIDRFGYGAVHFLLKLGKKSSGARYDDLKNLICELQVRTVLQDAWAIIDHHLVYKQESDIPSDLQRKLNSLAGLFETADNQFDIIRSKRTAYLQKLNKLKTVKVLLQQEINLDTVNEFLKRCFPGHLSELTTTQYVLHRIDRLKFTKLFDLDKLLNATEKARSSYIADFGGEDKVTAQGELFLALAFDAVNTCSQGIAPWNDLPNRINALLEKHRHLVDQKYLK